jgi:hypothetical protein
MNFALQEGVKSGVKEVGTIIAAVTAEHCQAHHELPTAGR